MRAYRALLHLYPSSFRREYGADLAADFARRRRDRSGAGGVALWIAAVADVVVNAARLHIELLRQDLKYAARTFARTPGFVVTAILVTALGIGATTAAFSVTNYVFLRPLPYADPDRLVTVWHRTPDYRLELSPPNFRDLKAQTTSFEALGAYHGFDANVVAGAEPDRLTGAAVTSEVLPLLGVRPVIGRLFTAEEERQATGSFAVLSYGFWQRAFGGDAGVLGRTIRIDGTPHVVVGVMPSTFAFPRRQVELWTLMPAVERLNEERDNYWFNAIGRLKTGVSPDSAEADLRVIAARLERQYPDVNAKISARVFPLREEYSDRARVMLYALCGASISVLLIACANLANLLLARSYSRRRELELRAALGAGRERLVRQLVTESLLVALLGGALGVLVAVASVPLLARLIPMSMPLTDTPSVDVPALLVAACLTLVTGIAFGVLPALRSSSTSSFDALREGVRGGGLRGVRTRSALVVIEVAACVVLLVWAGLLMRALHRLDSLDPGFQSEQVLTVQTALPRPKYNSAALRQHYFDSVLAQVRALPGVKSAAFISFLPMTMGGGIFPVGLPGQPAMMTNGRIASMRFATPGYFATLGIPLRRGRDLQQTDTLSQPLRGGRQRVIRAALLPGPGHRREAVRVRLRHADHRRPGRRRACAGARAGERAASLSAIHAAGGRVVSVLHAKGPRDSHRRVDRGAAADDSQHRARRRPRAAGLEHPHDEPDRRTSDRVAHRAGARAGGVRRDCAGAGRRGHPRAARVHRHAAPPRNRRAHGARRRTRAHRQRHPQTERRARGLRRRAWRGDRVRRRPGDGVAARGGDAR